MSADRISLFSTHTRISIRGGEADPSKLRSLLVLVGTQARI
jgi:hypothetical protein